MIRRLFFVAIAAVLGAAAQKAPEPEEKPGSVAGRVVNGVTGEPLRRVNLTLRPASPAVAGVTMQFPQLYSAASGDEGKFRIENLPAGQYQLTAERAGFVRGTYGARGRGAFGTTIQVNAGQTVAGLEFKLMPQAVITGRVVDEEGEPVMRAQVMLRQRRYVQGRWQLLPVGGQATQDNGEFRISSLQPGRYYLAAFPPMMPPGMAPEAKGGDYTMTFHPDSLDAAGARPLDLKPGMEMQGVDIRLRKAPMVRVRGRVEGAGGEQLRLSLISLEQESMMGPWTTAIMRPDGAFEIQRVRPGSYWLILSPVLGNMTALGRQELEVRNDDVENVVIRRGAAGTVAGQVRVDREREEAEQEPARKPALAGITVRLMHHDDLLIGAAFGRTNEGGVFTIENVGAGRYRLLSSAPAGTYLKAILAGGQDVRASGLLVSEGGAAQVEIVLGADPARLAGVVVNKEGEAVPGAVVTALAEPADDELSGLSRTVTTDQHGQFLIPALAPGEYILHAWEDIEPGQNRDPGVRKRAERYARTIKLKAKEQAQVSLTMAPASVAEAP